MGVDFSKISVNLHFRKSNPRDSGCGPNFVKSFNLWKIFCSAGTLLEGGKAAS